MIKKTTLILMMLFTVTIFAQTTIVSSGDTWKYFYNSSAPANDGEGDTWKQNAFNDSGWLSGASKLGNDNSPSTSVGNNPVQYTTYFRHTFNVADASAYSNISLRAVRDDGIVVYLNGTEIWRDNMPGGTVNHSTFANSPAVGGSDETTWYTSGTLTNTLLTGSNTIAVEIHQVNATSSDLSFDIELFGTPVATPPTPTAEAIPAGANWRYLDDGSNQGTAWRATAFDDSSWSYGYAELGYGDGDETTEVGYGPSSTNKYVTTYFRKEFTITDHTAWNSIDLEAVRDDGIVVYLNGTEIWRDHISGTVDYTTLADSPAIGGSDESAWITNNVSASGLLTGTNVIAVEIHQQALNSSDISFNFKLTPSIVPVGAPSVTRGPYLQSGTSTSVVIKWRTNNPTDTKVNYGTSLGSLSSSVSDGTSTTEHEITISGLTPNTKYYFNIANASNVYLPAESEMYIITAPTPGTEQFVRAWILGDAGTANQDQRDVRDAYYNYVAAASTNPGKTDMMLFLGDNAYNSGTDGEYQNALFDIYDEMLKKSVAWSCLGNHDGYSANSAAQTGPYYDIFTFPTSGEAGGTASGTEAYYSFDYANIHFIILNSYDTSRTIGGTMYNWAQTDIQNTTQDWIVVLFHHPPYTKGSHNSDTETELIQMRQNFMPMLESNGVDLVLSGHSHCYERSYFLNGHQGLSGTFNFGTHTVGATGDGDGKADSDGAYAKASSDTAGAVYITTGSAGKETGGSLNHPAMQAYSVSELGSCVLEVEDDGAGGQNLNVKFLRDTETIDDYFTINKTGLTLTADGNEAEQKNIKLFPVPAKDLINININLSERLQTVKFYNNIGELVKESKKETINVSNMATGMYVIEIATDKTTYYKSIIIE